MINRTEWIRRQLIDLRPVLLASETGEELADASEELLGTLTDIEANLYNLRATGTGQDGVRWPIRLFGKLQYLFNGVATADFAPTDQAREVYAKLKQEQAALADELARVVGEDVEAFNEQLRARGLGSVVTGVR